MTRSRRLAIKRAATRASKTAQARRDRAMDLAVQVHRPNNDCYNSVVDCAKAIAKFLATGV